MAQEVPLKKISTTEYKFVPPKAGEYLILAQVVPDFLTKTRSGFKLQSKKGLPDALSCFRFHMNAKTLINAGSKREGFDMGARSSLEIIPLKNPHVLKVGQALPIKVIFQGAPLAGAEVRVAHASRSDSSKPFVAVGKTDAQGQIQVSLDQPGKWLIVTSHKTPYHPREECDEHFYSTSFTFVVHE
ncbi:MAG: DUF4198 domain-containing protein [Deltaproteobacteria bacterium]|nr:DUF4198 domain-containing protein [Deltaproteobacteria bacterium]